MRLVLTGAEQRGLVAATAALLDTGSPDHAGAPDPWPRAVAYSVRALFGADFTIQCEASCDGAEHFSPELPSEAVDAHRRLAVADADRIRCSDPDVDPLYAARARFVWSSDLLDAWCGGRLRHTAVYDALWTPTRTSGVVGVVDSGAGVSHQLCVAYQGRSARRVDRALALLALLTPAHHAAVMARRRARYVRGGPDTATLAWTDALADGVLVVATSGRELHRNAALGALLAAEPERDALGAALSRMARAACAARDAAERRPGAGAPRGPDAFSRVTAAPATQHLRTATAVYAATASLLPGGTAVVAVRRVAGGAPPAADPRALGALAARAGLTAREAEVAGLLARGADNAAVAAALGVSPHTARHHTEHALRKLGVRSRRAVAARLDAARLDAAARDAAW